MPDPAPITRHLRSKATSHLLVAAVLHFNVFELFDESPLTMAALQQKLDLKDRPMMVLFPALCAMGLLQINADRELQLTELGKFLTFSNPSNLVGYTGLEGEDPGVLQMVEWLKHDGPANARLGFSYVKDEDAPSPMDDPQTARYFTMALAGRARYLSPVVASKVTKREGILLDVACGTGYYSYEWLIANPGSQAILFDRPEVLRVASELLDQFSVDRQEQSLKERVTFLPGDMLIDELPKADILLAASLFHDWPAETCQMLAKRFAQALNPGGELWVHDAFLNDSLDGPIAITDYSAMLFLGTKGRCYSRKEYREWFTEACLTPAPHDHSTLLDYGLIAAVKPGEQKQAV